MVVGVGFGEFGGEIVELHVVGMHQRADVAEGQQVVLGLQPENVEHRLRPEDAAAREVPIPQAAAAAVERGIDAAADGLVDHVRFARAGRLPVEGKAEDQHDEAGGGRQRDGERGERAPGRERRVARLHDGDLAERRFEHAHGRQRAAVVGQRDFHDAGAGAEGGERLRRTEQVDQAAADGGVGGRRGGRDHAVGIGQQEAPAGARWPKAAARCASTSCGRAQRVGGLPSGCCRRSAARSAAASSAIDHVAERLPAVIEHLHDGADADGGEKSDDQHRNGAAQQRLRGQQAPIRRLGDRLRETLDGI